MGVSLSHTQKSDAVDEYTAASMANGVTSLFDSDIGLARTGIASGGTSERSKRLLACMMLGNAIPLYIISVLEN